MSDMPQVTCLCPTYGRFQRLCEALACFLAQDYPDKHLIILNDAPERIVLPGAGTGNLFADLHCEAAGVQARPDGVVVVSGAPSFETLGHKRQALLEIAQTSLVAHWDDDDLYLPWHLSEAVAAIQEGSLDCTKVRSAWLMEDERIVGTHDQGNDGSMVFRRQAALDLGGYRLSQTGQSIGLLHRFEKEGRYAPFGDNGLRSVAVRRAPGHNLEARTPKAFRAANTDFGDGRPLTPADLRPLWQAVTNGTRRLLPSDAHAELQRRLADAP